MLDISVSGCWYGLVWWWYGSGLCSVNIIHPFITLPDSSSISEEINFQAGRHLHLRPSATIRGASAFSVISSGAMGHLLGTIHTRKLATILHIMSNLRPKYDKIQMIFQVNLRERNASYYTSSCAWLASNCNPSPSRFPILTILLKVFKCIFPDT